MLAAFASLIEVIAGVLPRASVHALEDPQQMHAGDVPPQIVLPQGTPRSHNSPPASLRGQNTLQAALEGTGVAAVSGSIDKRPASAENSPAISQFITLADVQALLLKKKVVLPSLPSLDI